MRPIASDNPGLSISRKVNCEYIFWEMVPSVFEQGEWYRLEVVHCGSDLRVYIDDELQMTIFDPIVSEAGKLGLGAYDGPAHIDVVQFTAFDEFCNEECTAYAVQFQTSPLGNCGGTATFPSYGYNPTLELLYILTSENNTIVEVNETGEFSDLSMFGTFIPHCLNIAANELPDDIGQLIGIPLYDFLDEVDCYDLLIESALVPVEPIEIEAEVTCNPETGIYDLIFLFDGGAPAWNGSLYELTGDFVGSLGANEEAILSYVDNQPYGFEIQDDLGCKLSIANPPPLCTFLAIELLHLEGVAESRQNVIYWSTASETENAYFDLQISSDGKSFESVAKIEGAGNSSLINKYYHIHETTESLTYYRLVSVSFNAEKAHSEVISISRLSDKETYKKLYPNPASDFLNVELELAENELVILTVLSVDGSKLWQQNVKLEQGRRTQNIPTEDFPVGPYILEVEGERTRFAQRFIISR